MSNRTDIRGILASPHVYRVFNWMVGASASYTSFVRDHVRPEPGGRLLDIGCGPGSLVPFLPVMDYVGFDISEEYIAAAQAQYARRGRFVCADVADTAAEDLGSFDVVVSYGVLHHLEDEKAKKLFEQAWRCLKTGGRLVTADGVFTDRQSGLVRWILGHDRGKYVRTNPEYLRLAASRFRNVTALERKDLLRIPYTHIVLECVK